MGLVIMTGASGSGKTTIAKTIEVEHPSITVFRFDTIGVPSAAVMATYGTGFQPGGAWQQAATLQWFKRIAPIVAAGQTVLFEGQMRIAFIQERSLPPQSRTRVFSVSNVMTPPEHAA
jgi:adenylate kinase family enzyme